MPISSLVSENTGIGLCSQYIGIFVIIWNTWTQPNQSHQMTFRQPTFTIPCLSVSKQPQWSWDYWCPRWHILHILLPRAVGTINRFLPPPSYDLQVNPKGRKADRSYSWSPCFDSILIKTPAIKCSCKLPKSSTNLKEPKDLIIYKVLGRI